MKCNFTAADIIAKVRELAAASPNFVYQPVNEYGACVNVVENADGQWVGSCIVGQAVVALGISAEELHENRMAKIGATNLLRDLGIAAPDDQVGWLSRVQIEQDDQVPWAKAVAVADFKHPATEAVSA